MKNQPHLTTSFLLLLRSTQTHTPLQTPNNISGSFAMLLLRFLYRRPKHRYCLLTAERTKFLSDFQFLQYSSLRFYSNVSKSTTQTSITKDYLVNVCGLSSKAALVAAKKVFFTSTERPNSVLNLFQSHGFPKTQITKLISKHPSLLISDPEKTLKPKMDFLQNLGISGPELAKVLSSDPGLLARGLKTQLIHSVEYLQNFLPDKHDIRVVFKRTCWVFGCNLEKVMGPNVASLCNAGIPKSNISKLLLVSPRALLAQTDRFNEVVCVVKQMGFDPSSLMFIYAVRIMMGVNKKSWERKLSLYKDLGWSEQEVLSMFKKQPICMALWEMKTKTAVDFFMNKLNWNVEQMCSNSTFLSLSMEKRIIPRCSVLGVLYSKEVLRRLSVKSALQMSDGRFLDKYVTGYQERIPDVLKAYEGEIDFAGFGKVNSNFFKRILGNASLTLKVENVF